MFFLILLNFLINIFFIFLESTNLVDPAFSGFIIILNEFFFFVKIVKEEKIFSPIVVASILNITFGMYVMKLVENYYTMSFFQMFIIMISTLIWKILCIICDKKVEKFKEKELKLEFQNGFKMLMFVLFLISTIAILYEWKMAGGIPIFRSDSETFRFTVPRSPFIHILAIMNKVIASLIGIYLINKEKIDLKKDLLIIIEMIIAELLMIGTTMRGELLMAPCVIGIAYFMKNKKTKKYYLTLSAIVLLVIGVFPLARNTALYGKSYTDSLKRISRIENLYFLTPMYQSFATNYSILALDFTIFPQLYNYGYGNYSILKEIPFVELGSNVMDVQNKVLNNNFYSGLTATYMASWYADFGYLGCIFSTLIYCSILNFAYRKYKKNKNTFSFVWYIYTFFCSLWLFYNSVFNIVFVLYSLLIYYSLKIKAK